MTKDIRSLEQTLADNLPWNKARIKFLARFLLALYAVRTVNLSLLATAFGGQAQEESNYKRLQRFLRHFELPYAQLAQFVVKFLGIPGPYTLALDRTNWQVGAVEVNILRFFVNHREGPQYLVLLGGESLEPVQVQPSTAEETDRIGDSITAPLEHLDLVVQAFDPAAV